MRRRLSLVFAVTVLAAIAVASGGKSRNPDALIVPAIFSGVALVTAINFQCRPESGRPTIGET